MEPFRLQTDATPPKPRRSQPSESKPARQRVLFSGLDCLAGQRDLFTTDGEDRDRENA